MKYEINVNDTPEKEDYVVVINIDDKTKQSASFALSKKDRVGKATQSIKSALYKFNNKIWKPIEKPKKKPSVKKPKKK